LSALSLLGLLIVIVVILFSVATRILFIRNYFAFDYFKNKANFTILG
jgi:hypothetical protein